MAIEEKNKSIIVSQGDSELGEIIAAQPKDFKNVELRQGPQEIWTVPKELKEMEDRYRFRWVSKDKRMVMRAQTKGWMFTTRVNCPQVPSHMFGVHGGVERFGHLLAYMPITLADKIRLNNQQKSADAVKMMTEKGNGKDPRFYKAKLSPHEEEAGDDKAPGLQQGRDF